MKKLPDLGVLVTLALGISIICLSIHLYDRYNLKKPVHQEFVMNNTAKQAEPSLSEIKQKLQQDYTDLYYQVWKKDKVLLENKKLVIVPPEILFDAQQLSQTDVSQSLVGAVSELCKLYAEMEKNPNDSEVEVILKAAKHEHKILNPLRIVTLK